MKKFLLLLTSGLVVAFLAAPVGAGAGGLMGFHEMYGDVSNINHATGVLRLANNEANMVLRFPPDSIKDLEYGDDITVRLGFDEGLVPASAVQQKLKEMGRKLKGVHQTYGDISNIDHKKGVLTVTNNEASMVLHFPPDSIKNLKYGDTITVELGFKDGMHIKSGALGK
ncbi:MAG TPA: hypothetical protein VMW07_07240 [Gallionella sp.]|nr:hypothetical protein [Gallionella sp.]